MDLELTKNKLLNSDLGKKFLKELENGFLKAININKTQENSTEEISNEVNNENKQSTTTKKFRKNAKLTGDEERIMGGKEHQIYNEICSELL